MELHPGSSHVAIIVLGGFKNMLHKVFASNCSFLSLTIELGNESLLLLSGQIAV